MRKINWLPIFTLLCVGCAPATYKTINDTDVPTPQEAQSRKFVIIKDAYLSNADHFSSLINAGKWSVFNKEIQKVTDPKSKSFLMAVRFMVDRQYHSALNELSYLNETDFDCQVKILKTDCLYELKSNTINFLSNYQEAVDCTPNEQVKSIAINRYRFIKYGI